MSEPTPADRLRALLADEPHPAVEDDPLAGLPQSPLSLDPKTDEEAKHRQHIAGFLFTAMDRALSDVERENALRHVLICDPARGLGMAAQMNGHALATLEDVLRRPAGEGVAALRQSLTEVQL